jgi:hypothetical protein
MAVAFDLILIMLAPGTGILVSSEMTPVIVFSCAIDTKHISIAMADEISFRLFMIISFRINVRVLAISSEPVFLFL